MYSAIQSFGECLSAWMEVKGLTPVSLSQYTRATRDATIARLMHDQLDYQRCARYITELAESELDIDEDTLRRLRRSVDVNRYGKEMYLARQNFLKMITPGEKQAENRPSMAAELCEKLLSWSESMDINLLCMGLTDAEPLRFLNLISEKKESIQIFHFFDQSHIVELSGLLALTLRLAFKPNYELYQIRDQMGTMVNNIMIARRSDGEHLLIAYNGSVFSTLNISKGTELLGFTLDIMMKRHLSPDKINRRFTHDSRDAYLDFLSQCLKLEKNSPIYHIKSEVGFEYVPTDILCDNFSDWALKFDPDFYPYLDRLREISALRYQNIHEKGEPTYLIMTKEGMISFAQTGRMKDHPFCLRAFTKDERKKYQ